MAESLSVVSLALFIAAGICLALAIFFWFYFRIPDVIEYLTGKANRKTAAHLRKISDNSSEKLTKKEPKQKKYKPVNAASSENPVTDILDENRAPRQELESTVLLEEKPCDDYDNDETMILQEDRPKHKPTHADTYRGMQMTMLDEICLIHTGEVIS